MKFAKIALAVLFSFTLLFAEEAPAKSDDSAKAIATKILGKYNDIKSFSAKYERVFTQSTTKKVTHDNGTILFIAPSDIRMDTYVGGEMTEQTFVDSKQTTLLYRKKKSAMVRKSADEAGEYLSFLKGLGEIEKKFTISDSTSTIEKAKKTGMIIKDGSEMIKLTPKTNIANVKYIFITAVNGDIDSVIIIDQLKNINQFTFSDIKHNPAIDKNSLKAVIPAGFEVSDF